MQLGVGGYSRSISMTHQQDDSFISPLADEGVGVFTVSMGAGELRREISENILASKGGANVTPWGGAFIMDDMSVDDGYEAAKYAALSMCASLKEEIGDLDKVKRLVKVSTTHVLVLSSASFNPPLHVLGRW